MGDDLQTKTAEPALDAEKLERLIMLARLSLRDERAVRLLPDVERVAVSLVLNRWEWLCELDLSMPQALRLIGPDWLACLSVAEEEVWKKSPG